MTEGQNRPFSQQLEDWLNSNSPKTLKALSRVFLEKSFAVLFLILMAIPALPIPTGGVTHIFEIIAMLLALELVIGRHSIWLPKKWLGLKIGKPMEQSAIPFLIKVVRKLEQYSRPRLDQFLQGTLALRVIGFFIFVFCFFAFIAPPFSGLDTLPAAAVVLISLAIILDDFLILVIGMGVGLIGLTLIIGLGTALVKVVF